MKFAVVSVMTLLALATASGNGEGSPVERVVKLLSTLKAQVESDGKHEQQIYDKYACWCEKTSRRKADDIDEARMNLRALGQHILKLKGEIATLAAEIAELTEKIESNEAEQAELTTVRQKENAAFMEETTELKEALAALQEAIKVLVKGTIPQKGSELIQEAQELRSKQAIKSVLNTLPTKIGLPHARMALLSEFVAAKTGYAPQSATIQGILSDMYLTFSSNVESATLDEANKNHDYEQLYATLEKENNELKATRERKEEQKAEAEAVLADTTKAYDDTEKQMKADMEFFDQTKAACESKHKEWTTRKEMRQQEIEGIEKALEILTSDDARELFANSIKPGVANAPGFLQIASAPALLQGTVTAPGEHAYNVLKAQVKKSHSVRLAALAVRIRSAKFGHFEPVIKAIDEMLVTLQEEGAADLAKKTQCLDEYQSITSKVKDLNWKIKNNKAEIEKLEELIALRTKEKEETIKKIKETEEYLADILAEREEENAAYLSAKKDDEDAIALLEKAKEALAKYYKKNGIKMGPVQGSVKLLQEDPEFEISKDQAPDATFSHKGSRKLESKDIVSLMTYIIEDLYDELSEEKEIEANAQTEYEGEKAAGEKLIEDLTAKKVHLTETIAKREEDKVDETKDMKRNTRDRDSEETYKAKIKPDCDWIVKAFDERATARAAEMNGLTEAKEYLAGQVTLLAKPKKFDDSKLSSIGFLGISH